MIHGVVQNRRRPTRAEQRALPVLLACLDQEREAIVRYREAIAAYGDRIELVELHDCLRSHTRRAVRLEEELALRGAEMPRAHAETFFGPASTFDAASTLDGLEDLETRIRAELMRYAERIAPDGKLLIERELLPEELRTYAVITRLRRVLPEGSARLPERIRPGRQGDRPESA